MKYSRAQPSPRYAELVALYCQMHVEGERFLGRAPKDTFPGSALLPQVKRIKRIIVATGAQNVLDYGCGKGRQYDLRNVSIAGDGTWESIQDYWDVDFVHCYDPCYQPFTALPTGTFDGVVCTDVLEHCPESDIEWIVDELFTYATRFVFANVACYPAEKRLPNGENAHTTLKPVDWWKDAFRTAAGRRPGVAWECWLTEHVEGRQVESCLRG